MSDWVIQPVSDGTFLLDGGSMFGAVPKVLWEQKEQADEKNRITMGLTSYLLRNGGKTVLVEAGMGECFTEKQMEIYGLKEDAPRLLDNLREAGVEPDDIDMVIFSHLHFDHSGWCARKSGGEFVPMFPNALHVAQRGEFECSIDPNPFTVANYKSQLIEAVDRAGLWRLANGDEEVLPGIKLHVTAGHTEFHQVVMIESEGRVNCFAGDFIPTRHHLRTHYTAAFDQFPLDLVVKKRDFLARAAAEGWRLLFNHDASVTMAEIKEGDDGHFHIVP